MNDIIARYQEIERRGLLDKLSPEKRAMWGEYKSRHPELSSSGGLTQEERQVAMQKAREINKQLGVINDDGTTKGSWVESDWVRKPVAVMQGIANADLNPAGYVARAFGMDTKPMEAKDGLERGLERGAGQAFDYATMAALGNAAGSAGVLGKGASTGSKIARYMLMGSPIEAGIAGAGGGLLSGSINSKDKYVDTALNLIGGAGAVAGAKGLANGFKAVKDIRNAPKEITDESFKKALSNKNSVRRMKNAIQAGNDDLQWRASEFVNNMEHYKAGAKDTPFAQSIKTPEFKKASEEYGKFIVEHGDDMLPDMKGFYKENPVAQGLIKNARKADPTTFKNIEKGSLAEADILKRLLNESSGATSGEKSFMQSAYKKAGDRLRTLMDKTSSGFREVNRNFAHASTNQDLFEKAILSSAKQVANSTPSPMSKLTGSTLSALSGGGVLAGLMTGNPLPLAAGVSLATGRAAQNALRKQAGTAVAKGMKPLSEIFLNTMKEYGIKNPQRIGGYMYLSDLINKAKGE